MAVSATVNEAGPISHQELWVKNDDCYSICPWDFIPVLPYLFYIRRKKKMWLVALERKAVIFDDVEGSGDSEWVWISVKIHIWIKGMTVISVRSCQRVTMYTCWDIQYSIWDKMCSLLNIMNLHRCKTSWWANIDIDIIHHAHPGDNSIVLIKC